MKKGKIKSAIVLFFIIILLFIVCLGVIMLFKSSNSSVPVNPNDVTYEGDSYIVSIKNIISVSSEFGRTISEDNNGAFGYILFDVVNHSNEERNYQLYVTKKDLSDNHINYGYVTFYLTDELNQPLEGYTRNVLPTFNQFHYIEDKASSKSIYSGLLKGNETAHFILRVWIAEPYVIHEPEETFSFEIGARAV